MPQRCKDVRIGSVLARGISGGQAKRVNIGIALVRACPAHADVCLHAGGCQAYLCLLHCAGAGRGLVSPPNPSVRRSPRCRRTADASSACLLQQA